MSKQETMGDVMDNILSSDISHAISYYRQYKQECIYANKNIRHMAGYYGENAQRRVTFLINNCK